MTLQHTVLLGFDPALRDAQRRELSARVRSWPDAIGELTSLSIGEPLWTERAHGFHYLLTMTFPDADSLHRYQQHPVHQDFLTWASAFGLTVLAFDYVLDTATVVL
jgi:hypothetical protein